jgi:glycosyl hydrolase family 113
MADRTLRKSIGLTLCYCWLLCFLGFRFEEIARELLTNGLLAGSLGASFHGWRAGWLELAIYVKSFSLPERREVYFDLAKVCLAPGIALLFIWLEGKLLTFSGKFLALYWALWSLVVSLQPLLFSTLFFSRPLARLWPHLPLSPIVKQALMILLLVLMLGLAAKIFRCGLVLGAGQFPVKTFLQRTVAVSSLFSLPLLSAWFLRLPRLVYFHFTEAWLYLAFAPVVVVGFSLISAVWETLRSTSVPSPKRSEILWIVSLTSLLLVAVPLSRGLERITNEYRLAHGSSPHLWISYSPMKVSPETVVSFSDAAEPIYGRVARQIGLQTLPGKVHFILFSSAEEKLFRTGSPEVADFDSPRNEIRLLFIPPFDRFDPPILARFLLHKRFGDGRNSFLESGLAALLVDSEGGTVEINEAGTAKEEVLANILAVEGPLSLSDLLFPDDPGSLSPFVSGPMGRELARFLQTRYGTDRLLALYSKTLTAQTVDSDILDALATSRAQLQNDWQRHLAALRDQLLLRFQATSSKPKRRPSEALIPFQKGMSVSSEGGARSGYMSEAACASLDQLQQLHVEWLSLMPFAFSSWAQGRPRLSFSYRNSWEGDDNLRKISWEAHRRGMRIFLKPHVWSRGKSTVDFKISESQIWNDWFASYRRYILHEARLSEAIGAELFSVGNELPLLTLDPAHEASWRSLISEVRKVFSGDVTYCANWGEDFEQIRFADALDVVGLNAYYPLVVDPNTSRDECRKGARAVAERVASVAARLQRPIIVTEIGYPSSSQAARRPWSEDGSDPSVTAQAEAASAFLEAFWDRSWLRGIYWWKWYSHGRGGGENDDSYMPRGKPLAAIISDWYSRPRR